MPVLDLKKGPEVARGCEKYLRLARELTERAPTATEVSFLLDHEDRCEDHSVEGLERELKLSSGALSKGNSRVLAEIKSRLRIE